eukprot:2156253-Prymnesium_polylepis.2
MGRCGLCAWGDRDPVAGDYPVGVAGHADCLVARLCVTTRGQLGIPAHIEVCALRCRTAS